MNQIEENAKRLKLAYLREFYQEELTRAEVNSLSYEEFLDQLLKKEVDSRQERAIQNRVKNAKFPFKMRLEDFRIDHYTPQLRSHIKALKTLEFIKNKENIILVGNPGVGKTALAISLGYKACLEQKNVLFLNASNLLIQIEEAMSQDQILRYKRKFENYDLVILDELGFVSFDRASGEILFNLLSSRNEKGSMIITSNLTVDQWNEIFHDPVMTTAIVDRLAFRSHLIDMSGESFRVKNTAEWQKEYFEKNKIPTNTIIS